MSEKKFLMMRTHFWGEGRHVDGKDSSFGSVRGNITDLSDLAQMVNLEELALCNQKIEDKDVVITKDTHPAIVSEEEYEIAKASIAFMKKPDYRGTRKFALKGKVRCGNCKRAMVLVESGSNDKMYCPHKKTTGKFAKCSGEMFSVSIIEGHVWYALKRVFYILDAIQLELEEKTTNLDNVRRKKDKTVRD